MRVGKWILAFAALAALAGCGQAAGGGTAAPPDSKGFTVTDMTGREVTLDAPADKVVALTAADCEILFALGAGNTLIGRGTYCNYPSEALQIPEVESGGLTNIEQIVALKPQVVIMSTMAQTAEQTAALEAAGIRAVASSAVNIAGVYEDIAMIGAVTGKTAEADRLIAGMKAAFADITAKVKGSKEKTVYFEVSPLAYGLWAAGSGTFMDEIASMLGLTNTFADVNGWGEVSEEQVIERNPDYIFTSAMYETDGPDPVTEIMQRAGWQNVKAIQNNHVFHTGADEITRPGPRLTEAAQELYGYVYGAD